MTASAGAQEIAKGLIDASHGRFRTQAHSTMERTAATLITDLTNSLAEAEEDRTELRGTVGTLDDALSAAETEATALREAFVKYGRHIPFGEDACHPNWMLPNAKCTCGFDAATQHAGEVNDGP